MVQTSSSGSDLDASELALALQRHRPVIRANGWRVAGVAAVFRFQPDPELLFVRRARRGGDPWSGDMAFPGGYAHGDESGRTAAIRETAEETRLELGAPIGRLSDRRAIRPDLTGLLIEPWVFVVDGDPPLVLEENEVVEAVWLPWSDVARPATLGRQRLRSWPILAPTRKLGRHRLWGLTNKILDELVRVVGRDDQAP